jgi:pimeloyl-ACP methyl ester carboxylesterase
VRLAWESVGEGPSAFLVHETGTDSAAWRPLAERIAALGGRAIAYDRRGWGSSSAPAGYARTTIEEQSEDLAHLVAALGAPAALCGAGIGGLIALDLLLRRPELVASAVLIEPALPGLLTAATEALSEDRSRIERVVAEGGVEALVELYLGGGLAALGPGAERLPAALTEPARSRPGTLVAELGAPANWSMPLRRLAAAERGVSLPVSADTPPLSRAAAEALETRLPEALLTELPGVGPAYLGDPEKVAELALGRHGGRG